MLFRSIIDAPLPYVVDNPQWNNLAIGRFTHQYPADLRFEVDPTNTAVWPRGRQLGFIQTPRCGPTNIFAAATAGYYEGVTLGTAFPGVVVNTAPTVDVLISGGINAATVVPIAVAGLQNGTYRNVALVIGSAASAIGDVTVTAGVVSAVVVTNSGQGYTPGAGLNISVAANGLYAGSPEIAAIIATIRNNQNGQTFACASTPPIRRDVSPGSTNPTKAAASAKTKRMSKAKSGMCKLCETSQLACW